MLDNLLLLPRLKSKRLSLLLKKLKRPKIKPIKLTEQLKPPLQLKRLLKKNLLPRKKLRAKLKK